MIQQTQLKGFDWAGELHKTMIHSLTTSFGLDFLLFEDKKGGNVDTTQKVREYQQELNNNGQSDIHVSDEMHNQLTSKGKNKEAYNSHSYHSNASYITRGQQDKASQKAGQLHDEYRGTKMAQHEKRQLDHIQSASEIHHDAARILSGSDGVTLANQDSNLSSTLAYINTKKSDMPIQEFVDKLPEMKKQKQNTIQKTKNS
ncbi:hypothetical protein [Neisseria animaloris]|uniref:hypothetical protein n=1 Tax=Neisseria animaloris TaxID=326522 RepID=UPI000D2F6E11|nr:hypothetical protein [Neisseria animaloris]